MNVTRAERIDALAVEYAAFRAALAQGDTMAAWRSLERAHIIGQPVLLEHVRTHWLMLLLARRERDYKEIAGQALRLLLSVPGNLSGRLPIGNNGRARVSAFRSMTVAPDLQRFVG